MEGARLETEAEGEKQKGEGEPSLLVGGVQWPHLGLVRVGYTPTCWAESPLEPYSLIHMCTLGVPVPALTSKDADILKSSWEQGSQTGSLLPGCPQVRGMPLAPSNTLPSPIHRSGGGKLRGVGGVGRGSENSPTCHLFLHSPQAKNGYFTCLNSWKNQKKNNF